MLTDRHIAHALQAIVVGRGRQRAGMRGIVPQGLYQLRPQLCLQFGGNVDLDRLPWQR